MKPFDIFRYTFYLILACQTSACTLAPKYVRPEAPVATSWPVFLPPTRTAVTRTPAENLGWHEFFTDPALQRLIVLALQNNRDLRVSILNIEAARAQYNIQHAQLLPTVDVIGGETATRLANGILIPGEPAATRYDSLTVGISAYEIDLFGKIRSLSRAAFEQYLGLKETARSAQLALIASVADAYFTVLADRELLRLTEETEHSQGATYDLTQRTLQFGTGTELAVRQAQTALLTAKTNQSLYARQLAIDTDALVLLLGAPIPADLPKGADIDAQNLVATLPPALPSSVLIQRPDVLAAEHNLIAANADIGAARAAFFPSITLTGDIGVESLQLAGLFKPGAKTWAFIPQFNLPIFTAGANRATLNLAKVQKRIEIATYEKTIQTAFREVSDALVGLATLDDQLASQKQLVRASQQSYDLADLRFKNGVDSYLTTLDSERSLYSARLNLVGVELARLQNLVATYQALGGGWKETTPP